MFGKTLPTDHSYTWCIINDTDDEKMVEVQKKLFSMGIYWNGGNRDKIKCDQYYNRFDTISFGFIPNDIGFRRGDGNEPWAQRQIKASEFLKW